MKEELKVGFIQADLYWESPDANLPMLEEQIWDLEDKTDVIILPEMFSTGFSMNAAALAEPMNSRTFRWMKQIAAEKDSLVIGSYIVREDDNFYNRLFAVRPDGTFSTYDKKHLFTLAGEHRTYTAGKNRLILEWRGWNICPMICYDLRFPVWSKNNDFAYDLLIYIASWPMPRINAWDTLLKARAIENQCYTLGVNRTGSDGSKAEYNGHSAAVNYLGNYLAAPTEDNQSTIVKIHKQPMDDFRCKYNFIGDAAPFVFT